MSILHPWSARKFIAQVLGVHTERTKGTLTFLSLGYSQWWCKTKTQPCIALPPHSFPPALFTPISTTDFGAEEFLPSSQLLLLRFTLCHGCQPSQLHSYPSPNSEPQCHPNRAQTRLWTDTGKAHFIFTYYSHHYWYCSQPLLEGEEIFLTLCYFYHHPSNHNSVFGTHAIPFWHWVHIRNMVIYDLKYSYFYPL